MAPAGTGTWGWGRQSKTGYPLLPEGIIEEGMVHAQGKGFPLPLALRDVVIFTVIFFYKMFRKENGIQVPKSILVCKW